MCTGHPSGARADIRLDDIEDEDLAVSLLFRGVFAGCGTFLLLRRLGCRLQCNSVAIRSCSLAHESHAKPLSRMAAHHGILPRQKASLHAFCHRLRLPLLPLRTVTPMLPASL